MYRVESILVSEGGLAHLSHTGARQATSIGVADPAGQTLHGDEVLSPFRDEWPARSCAMMVSVPYVKRYPLAAETVHPNAATRLSRLSGHECGRVRGSPRNLDDGIAAELKVSRRVREAA